MSFLLDTNVISELIRPRPDRAVTGWFGAVDADRMYLSVASLAEVRRGLELLAPSERRDRLVAWLERELPIRFERRLLGVDAPLAHAWGRMRARAQRLGLTIEGVDALLAATAQEHGLTLVTRNVRDFGRLGVPILNPWEPQS